MEDMLQGRKTLSITRVIFIVYGFVTAYVLCSPFFRGMRLPYRTSYQNPVSQTPVDS
jgi:hypothetical protein